MKNTKILIGITGTDGAGKGTVVDYLVHKYDFVHFSARAIFIEELTKQGRGTTRVDLRLMGNELREKYGNDFLITYYLKKMSEDKVQSAIIESVRTISEAETLKKAGGILLAVDAGQALRYARVQERRSESDKVSFEQFVEHEELETNDPNPHGMQKRKVMERADYTLLNNGTQEELHAQIDALFSKLLKVA